MPASCSSRRDHSPTHSMLFPFPERLIFEQSARRAPASRATTNRSLQQRAGLEGRASRGAVIHRSRLTSLE